MLPNNLKQLKKPLDDLRADQIVPRNILLKKVKPIDYKENFLKFAREKMERWRNDYNECRPRSVPIYLPPAEFAGNHTAYGHC
jgi:hypothetical protein